MKKALVLVLSAILVLSLATIASAGVEIVGGQFAVEYKADLNGDPVKPTFGIVGGDTRLNIEGKYSVGNFKGYAYSRFDLNKVDLKPSTLEGDNKDTTWGDARWYFKKAEVDYTLFDGFSIGLSYDVDDIKIHDEFVYSKKLKDYYKGVPMISTKYSSDMLNLNVYNNAYVGGKFAILGTAKLNIEDAKVRSLVNFEQTGEETNKFETLTEASYTIDDFTFGAGVDYSKATNADAATSVSAGAEYVWDAFTFYAGGTYDVSGERFDSFDGSVAYGNYELSGSFEPEDTIEVVGKIKNVAGSKDEIQLKSTFGYNVDKFDKPVLSAKYTFKF